MTRGARSSYNGDLSCDKVIALVAVTTLAFDFKRRAVSNTVVWERRR